MFKEDFEEIEKLIARGRIIPAIKRYRELTGQGLKESKMAVDFFRSWGYWEGHTKPLESREDSIPEQPSGEFQTVIDFLEQGRKIKAIKEYRALAGCGLKEAMEAINYYQTYGHWENQMVINTPQADTSGMDEVERLAKDPMQKIRAIKAYRIIKGTGLKESKEEVEFFIEHGYWRDSDLGTPAAPSA